MKYQRYPHRLDMFFIALLTEKHYLLYVKEIIILLISMEEMIGNFNMIF